MQKPIFNRYERKYILTSKQKDEMIEFLKQYLIEDPYSLNGSKYAIFNIYFDTPDYAIIRNSIMKPKYKDKLRLRSYTKNLSNEEKVFLEIKKKYDGFINKRRVVLKYGDAIRYIEQGILPELESYLDQQIMQEIDYFIHIHQAKPGAYIHYDRIALMSPDEELRITFDSNITFRTNNITLESTEGTSVLQDKDSWLMEIKSENNFPFWLARKLSELQLYSQSFSKYGVGYQNYITGGTHVDYILY